jgi:hypothetical protein
VEFPSGPTIEGGLSFSGAKVLITRMLLHIAGSVGLSGRSLEDKENPTRRILSGKEPFRLKRSKMSANLREEKDAM